MANTYKNLDMAAKAEYQKTNGVLQIAKAMAVLAAANDEDLQAALDLRPAEVYKHLTGEDIGNNYLYAIVDANVAEDKKIALQMSKMWQDIKMPVRKMMQWKATNRGLVKRFTGYIENLIK